MHALAGAGRVVGGRYRLRDSIGRGAMGTVWRARDQLLDRDVAVKEVQVPPTLNGPDRQALYERTFREARTAARLSHPGVVTVFDVVEEDSRPWIVMELVRARSLDQVLAEDGPLTPQQAADVGQQLVGALATAHAAGVLHRDVKPSNVLLSADGRAVLTDFGIATFEGDAGLTQTGMVMGTPAFTPPERIRGEPATPSSDLWSLGATLYAAVQGRGPYQERGGALTTMNAVINEDAPAAPSAGRLGPVIAALMHKDPAARLDAATAAKLLAGVVASRPAPRTEKTIAPGAAAAAAGVAAAAAGAGAAGVGAGAAGVGAGAAGVGAGAAGAGAAGAGAAGVGAGAAGVGAGAAGVGAGAAGAGAAGVGAGAAGAGTSAAAVPPASRSAETLPSRSAETLPSRSAETLPAPASPAQILPPGTFRPAAAGAGAGAGAAGVGAGAAGARAGIPGAAPGAGALGAGAGAAAALGFATGPPVASPPYSAPVTGTPSYPPPTTPYPQSPAPYQPSAAPYQAPSASCQPPAAPYQAPSASCQPPAAPYQAAPSTPYQSSAALHQAPSAPYQPSAAAYQPPAVLYPPRQYGPGGPGQPGAPRRNRGGRRTLLVGCALVAAIVFLGVLSALAKGRHQNQGQASGTHDQQTGSTGQTSHGSNPPGAGGGTAGLPAGFAWYIQPAARTGTAAGFRLAVPQGWSVTRSGLATYIRPPSGGGFMEVDLTPHSFLPAMAEARWLQTRTRQQGKFPGYRRISLRPVTIHGSSGAEWTFSWLEPEAGRIVARDYLFALNTGSGSQSYALYGSAPIATWPQGSQYLTEALTTLQPLP